MKNKKERKPLKKWQKGLLIGGIALGGVIVLAVGVLGGYVGYVSAQYYRIEDKLDLTNSVRRATPEGGDASQITADQELSIMSYNIGFGAYDQEYSFFMDTGELLDGTKTQGKYGRAVSKESAQKNTDGSVKIVKEADVDFTILQEVDADSDRAYHINQYDAFLKEMTDRDGTYASCFHTAKILYPLNSPMGKTECGQVTLSRFNMDKVVRHSYPVDESWPAKLFDLDRCFSICRYTLSNGKELLIGNSHMSAYDEGGKIRKKQLDYLCTFLEEERNKGNYVVFGGDFNHDIANSEGLFPTQEKHPDWVATFSEENLPEGFSIAAATNAPTCRSADIPYEYGKNFLIVIDGFIVSDNVQVKHIENLDLEFLYSDHNPAVMRFTLDL